MKKSSLISLLPQILLSHKEWFESKGNRGIFADLSEEDLRENNFKNAVLVEANFQGADLRGADFENADLRGANLQDVQLNGARLNNANFEETDLMWANLENADLHNTRLDGAYLQGATPMLLPHRSNLPGPMKIPCFLPVFHHPPEIKNWQPAPRVPADL